MQVTCDIAWLYRTMLLIRKAEQHLRDVYTTDVIKSPVHLSIGQEAVSAAVCYPLMADDFVANTYRGHGTYIAKNGDLNAFMAELYGKKTGCAKGKAGSMHTIDMEKGVMGSSAVVGTTIPVSMGLAWALKNDDKGADRKRLVVSVFGDGATEEGCFYESLNMAKLHELPILFVCENNGLAIHSKIESRWSELDICRRVEGFGLSSKKVSDGSVLSMAQACTDAVSRLRAGSGPEFLELSTYRWLEHVGITDDHHEEYRNEDELASNYESDQIEAMKSLLDANEASAIDRETTEKLNKAIEFAVASEFPDTLDELYADVYSGEV